ncbi:MAG: VTT domain-containing protein [Fimbriiglobus sp.]|jgi:membrane-associated protein|nr:VTT domain-containing protein [Fimbriiglobus sp.]
MGEFFQKAWDILCTVVVHLRDPMQWQEALNRPGVFWPAVAALAFIIFAETGLLVGFFLPGDSLLVTVGIVARALADTAAEAGEPNAWNIWTLTGVLIAAAIIGDTVGYWFGAKTGPKLFNRPNSRWFKRDHLLAAKAFFDRHGGKTIIIARFMPFARTFVPVVAGAAHMNYRWFFAYNVIGGVAWIGSMLLFGYFATDFLEPPLKAIFGPDFKLAKKIDVLALVIIALSLSPMVIHYLIERRRKKRDAARAATPAPTP